MEKIEAKVIIKDQYWILHKNQIKVGQIRKAGQGLEVRINGQHATTFKDLSDMQQSGMFTFTEIKQEDDEPTDNVHGFPTDGLAHNSMWNLQYRLPLFTKSAESKSWYAAGWYYVQIKGKPRTVEFCPKLITLQRNQFEGPYVEEPRLFADGIFEKL